MSVAKVIVAQLVKRVAVSMQTVFVKRDRSSYHEPAESNLHIFPHIFTTNFSTFIFK